MKNILFAISVLFVVVNAHSQDAEAILKKVDENMSSKNRIFESTMIINGRRASRTITSKSWSEGSTKAFTEYLTPARENGTKMLKLEGLLWIYSPSTDRTIQISGNMLRQSVMGSDLSYEDMMDDRKLTDIYDSKINGEEQVDGRNTWIIELTAKVQDIAYAKRIIWIDEERYVPLKEELFAKSGQLLKRMELKDVKKIEGRWFPTNIVYKDMLKEGDGTQFIMTDIKFDQDIPEYIFSKAALKK